MKQTILFTIMLFYGVSDIIAQHVTDTIQIRKNSGSGYSWDGNFLNKRRMKSVLLNNEEATKVYLSAVKNRNTAYAFLISGGIILGGSLVTNPSHRYIRVGGTILGGLVLISSTPFYIISGTRTRKAVKIYNNEIKQIHYPEKTVSIGLNSSGLGIRLTF